MNPPLVSVVMPTYRRPHYLREALASVVGQTYENLQIIVRDNASGDETPDIVRSIKDARIEFYQAERTGSVLENGEECRRRVRGKYVFPLCDDDLAGSTYIEVLVRYLEEDDRILAAYGATDVIDEKGDITGKRVPHGTLKWRAPEVINAWCHGTLPLASVINYIAPMSFVGQLGRRHYFVHGHNSDNAIFMTAAIRGFVLFTDQTFFSYRKHSQNSVVSFTYQERMEGDSDFLAYLDDEVNAPSNTGLPRSDWRLLRRRLRTMLAEAYYHLFREYHLQKEAMPDLIRASLLEPMKCYGLANCLKGVGQSRSSLFERLKERASNIIP